MPSVVVEPAPAALGDRVWLDLNGNGIQDCTDSNGNGILGDAGDDGPECQMGIDGVTVQLFGGECVTSGQPLATQSTVNGGFYLFDRLVPGTYCVKFELSTVQTFCAGAPQFTARDAGNDDVDSDANPADGVARLVALEAGEMNRTVDAGIVCECKPWSAKVL